MKIGQIVKTSDNQCKASIVQIKGDRVRIKMTWKSGLSYISDFHQYSWYDKSFIAPLLDTGGKYGILKAKVTNDLQAGVKNKFILSASELREVIETLES